MVKVTVSGVTKEYETGITYGEVSKDFKENCKYDIILAKQDAKLIELNKKIKTDCEIEFLDISDPNGHKTYVRGVNLLLLDAFYEVCKDMPLKNVFIKYMGPRVNVPGNGPARSGVGRASIWQNSWSTGGRRPQWAVKPICG